MHYTLTDSNNFLCIRENSAGATCLDTNTNPNYGYTSFDNFAAASYCIFQMLTLDAWTSTLLYPLMNSIGAGRGMRAWCS